MSENAVRSSSGRDVQRSEQSIGVINHLCGLMTSESASSTPSCDARSSSQIQDEPAYAASTWSHAPAACARPASSRTGSTEANDVVPTVATTAATSPSSSPSVRMPSASSVPTFRSSIPSIRAAFSTDECACSEQTTTLRPVMCRAAMSAASVDVDAVSSMCPCQPSGNPSSRRTQSTVRISSSVDAGDARQTSATWLSVAESSSARIPGSDAVTAK